MVRAHNNATKLLLLTPLAVALATASAALTAALAPPPATAFPQFERWISKKAGFAADCAYCHINRQGPQGDGLGQLGQLSDKEQALLHTADSPILNSFGQHLIKKFGYAGVIQTIPDPSTLAAKLMADDLDGDGVADGVEMEHGTLANDPLSAPPELIWRERLRRNQGLIAAIIAFTLVGAVGLYAMAARAPKS